MDKTSRYNVVLKEEMIFKSIHENYKDDEKLNTKIREVMELDSFFSLSMTQWLYKKPLFITNSFSKYFTVK